MNLSPAQVDIFLNFEPFRAALAKMAQAINASAPQLREFTELLQRMERDEERIQRDEARHHVRTQYRRKSRGHR